jgi:hypothetical protein
VIAPDGQTYERSAIHSWIEHGNNTSPFTRQEFEFPLQLIPNIIVRQMVENFFELPDTFFNQIGNRSKPKQICLDDDETCDDDTGLKHISIYANIILLTWLKCR